MGRPTQKFVTANKDQLEKISEEHKYLIEDFLIYCKAEGKSPKTIVNYRSDLNIFFCWYEENCKLKGKYKPFSKIKVQDVIKLQSYLVELGMSSSRMERFKASISSLSNYCENILAEDEDYPEFENFRNIIRKVKSVPKEEVREKTILTDVQCQNFLNKLVSEERYQQACAFALAWASGRRKAELLCIKCSHISDENLKFGALYKTPEKIKTKGKMLNVYVLKSKFKPYYDLWMQERERLGVPSDIDEIFVRKNNGVWVPAKESQLNYYADIFSEELDVFFYWHCMRHNFCTELLKAGIPESVVQQVVGWQSAAMISIYDDRDKDDVIGEYFNENGIIAKETKGFSDL